MSNDDRTRQETLTRLEPGQVIPYGGDRFVRVTPQLAEAFTAGDRLVVVQSTGDLLHIPAQASAVVDRAVGAAVEGFTALSGVSDEQITRFFDLFAAALEDDETFAPIAAANAQDLDSARQRGRATGRLELTGSMRNSMIEALRMWRDTTTTRSEQLDVVDHDGWSVSSWRSPLGVVGFVFEGRPNVFADACGVLRTGNAAVLRIGSDALGTARAIVAAALQPSLAAAGLPSGCVQLVDSADRAAGWALFADRRLSLAIARGSGAAVAQLGAVARQHGVPVSLHGTGGAWLVAAEDASADEFAVAVEHSLDRKVCNTLNVCCVVANRPDLVSVFHDSVARAAARRGVDGVIHERLPDDPELATEYEWDEVPEVALVVVESVDHAVELCNRYSPRFIASVVSADPTVHDRFYATVDAPFVGNGFTRWVDGQYALGQPELGLSNWQDGRLFGRGGVLSGDSVFTVRLRATVTDPAVRR